MTAQQIERVRILQKKGYNSTQIAEKMGVSSHAVMKNWRKKKTICFNVAK